RSEGLWRGSGFLWNFEPFCPLLQIIIGMPTAYFFKLQPSTLNLELSCLLFNFLEFGVWNLEFQLLKLFLILSRFFLLSRSLIVFRLSYNFLPFARATFILARPRSLIKRFKGTMVRPEVFTSLCSFLSSRRFNNSLRSA